MQFRVPQFIEIEDKIIGPLTIKQFLYLVGGAGILAVFWFYLTLVAFILVSIPVIIFVLTLTFYKVNGRPFVFIISSFIKYITKPRLYLWRKK